MKLHAQIGEKEFTLRLETGDGRIIASVDDRSYELEVREPANGEYLLFAGTEVYPCFVSLKEDYPEVFAVHLRGNSYEVQLTDPKRLRSGQSSGRHNHGSAKVLAPMPGKIVRVLVELGAEVEAGAGLVVVEAMKMQNEMKAPKAGTVVSLVTEIGKTVNSGEVLAIIE